MQANRFWSPKSSTYQCLIFLCSPLMLRSVCTQCSIHLSHSFCIFSASLSTLAAFALCFPAFSHIQTEQSFPRHQHQQKQKEKGKKTKRGNWTSLLNDLTWRRIFFSFCLLISYRLSILISLIAVLVCVHFVLLRKKQLSVIWHCSSERSATHNRPMCIRIESIHMHYVSSIYSNSQHNKM